MPQRTDINEKQSFLSHLQELRNRIVFSLIAMCAAFVVSYAFKDRIFMLLMEPFSKVMPAGSSFVFTGVTEAFTTYIKISLVSSLVLASPVILYQFWIFVSPGLYEYEKKYAYPFIVWTTLCFVCGALFCYFVIMPLVYAFFAGYATEFIVPMPDLRNYVNLSLKMLVGFGLIFEIPPIIYFLSKTGVLRIEVLTGNRRLTVLVLFILSAVFSNGSISGMILLAFGFWVLYEVCVVTARLVQKKEKTNGGA
jgi:sec-independent protein translocase protein TatC